MRFGVYIPDEFIEEMMKADYELTRPWYGRDMTRANNMLIGIITDWYAENVPMVEGRVDEMWVKMVAEEEMLDE